MFALIMYIFAVMCTELFGDIDYTDRFNEPTLGEYDYFSRLDYSLFTLFHMVTLDWAKVTRATMQEFPWAWAIFSTFVTFSSFVLYNLIVAVVCDAVKMVQDKQDILMVENYVKDKIESRHRIINLRQKLDKMSKQQMDLLLYVQLLLEQLDDLDDTSKEHYEETLSQLGQTNQTSRAALQLAIRKLDDFDRGRKHDPTRRVRKLPLERVSYQEERNRSVSFKPNNPNSPQSSQTALSVGPSKDDDSEAQSDSQNFFFANEDTTENSGQQESEIDDSFHSCSEGVEVLESSFRMEVKSTEEYFNY